MPREVNHPMPASQDAAVLRRRRALLWAVSLALIVFITRLPFMSEWLYHWDSVNYALGMQQFDLRLHQPHPPGYLFYIALAQGIDLLVGDANASLVWLSVLSSAFGVALLFLLGRELFGWQTALIAAALFASSPNVWFHGEVALPRAIEAFFSIALALMCYRLRQGDDRYFLPAAAALALAGGFRQQVLIFLLPLWVWAGWGQPIRRWLSAAVVGLAVTLAWVLPTFALSGGLESGPEVLRYLWQQGGLSETGSASGLTLVALKIVRLATYSFYGLVLGVLAVLYPPAWRRGWQAVRTRKGLFFLVWTIPALLITFNWVEQPGHILVFLPALCLLVAQVVTQVGQDIGRRWRGSASQWAYGIAGVLIAANVLFFLAAPPALFGREGTLTIPTAARAIDAYETFLHERVTAVRAAFAPEGTTVLAGGRFFRHPDYYLADYQYPMLQARLDETTPTYLSEDVRTLVLLTDDLLERVQPGVAVDQVDVEGGALYIISAAPGEVFALSEATIALADVQPAQPDGEGE